jgi:hypothetical protein
MSRDSAKPGIGDVFWKATAREVKTAGLVVRTSANPMSRHRATVEHAPIAVAADRLTSLV